MVRQFNTNFAEALLDDRKNPIYGVSILGILTAEISSFSMSTGIVVDDVTDFPDFGALKINDELFTYSSINVGANRFDGLKREVFATVDAGDPIATDTVRLAYLISSDEISGQGDNVSIRNVIQKYSGASQRLNSLQGQSSTGSVTVSFLDFQDFFTEAMGINLAAFRDKELRVIVGFDSLIEDEYEIEFLGFIQSLKMDSSLTAYVITAGDTQRLLHAPITLGKTKLRTEITGTPTNIDVGTVKNFDPNGGFARIDDEIIAYTSTTSGSVPTLNTVTRAQFGTISVDHDLDATVSEIFEIQGNPVDIMLRMLTSTGLGTNGSFDDLSAEKGIGIDQSLIDFTSFEFERDNFFPDTVYRFRLTETITDVKTWFEQEILTSLNSNFKANADGMIGFVFNRPIFTLSESVLVDENIIEGKPSWDQNLNSLVNQVTINRDVDVFDGQFKISDIFLDVTSQSLHGLGKDYTLDLSGIHDDLDGTALSDAIETQIRRRFGNPPAIVKCNCKMQRLDLEVGDIIFLSHPSLPNFGSIERGLRNVQYQVIQRTPNYLSGMVKVELLDTRRTGKFGAIAPNVSLDNPPDAFPDYVPAGPLDRQYVFISGNNGRMSNGDDGYLII